jgi:hypothetical protein
MVKRWMAGALLAAALCGGLAGCRSQADVMALNALKVSWSIIGPSYKGYIAADPLLQEPERAQKRIQLGLLADDITRLLEERTAAK